MAENPSTTNPPALLPCPFCGGTSYVADDYGSSFSVKCNNPVCGGAVRLWGTREKAIAAWNRRACDAELLAALIRIAMHELDDAGLFKSPHKRMQHIARAALSKAEQSNG